MLKRSATSDLNHTNWDDEDEPEEPSDFKLAGAEVMSKRIIKTGQRRLAKANQAKSTSSAPFAKFNFGSIGGTTTAATGSSNAFSFLPKPAMVINETSPEIVGSPEVRKMNAETDKQAVYHAKLKGLNEELLSWIDSHMKKNPTCIFTPVFSDYDKHLKEIQKERDSVPSSGASIFGGFKFSTASIANSSASPTNAGFLASSVVDSNKQLGSSLFGNPLAKSTESPFTLGGIKPFSFGSAVASATQQTKATEGSVTGDDETDEPPKNDFKLVTEEDAVFSQKVKVFVKKDAEDYADRGVGTLYIKPANGKFQAIVRADTSLGNLLLNIILTEGTPCKRMGKNNVLLVCIPIPGADSKPLPTLLKVKTSEDADLLFEQLNSHKK